MPELARSALFAPVSANVSSPEDVGAHSAGLLMLRTDVSTAEPRVVAVTPMSPEEYEQLAVKLAVSGAELEAEAMSAE